MILNKENIEQLIKKQQERVNEIEEWCGEDFNAADASGDNFDDAYELGRDHGFESGKLAILMQLR